MSTTVDYRSSEEVISVLKEALTNVKNQIQYDAVVDLTLDEDSQATNFPTSAGDGGVSSEQLLSPPTPPAENLPPTHNQFLHSVLKLKGNFFFKFRVSPNPK